MIVLLLGTLGLVFFISFRINRLQYTTAMALFMLYAALLGVTLSSIFLTYTGASITRVFFISAASFGALSLYGYTTQRDLSAMGSFLIMGLFGIIIAYGKDRIARLERRRGHPLLVTVDIGRNRDAEPEEAELGILDNRG